MYQRIQWIRTKKLCGTSAALVQQFAGFSSKYLASSTRRASNCWSFTSLKQLLNNSYAISDKKVNIIAGRQEILLSTVKRGKFSWFGHVYLHDTLPKIILQGTMAGRRHTGRPRESLKENIKEWTGQSMSAPSVVVIRQSQSEPIA